MISLAIAVKDPAATRRYRQLLTESGCEALYITTIIELVRTVKSRPIDVVIFDLGLSSLPASEWLTIVEKDNDLALTPVLWIGSNIPRSLTPAIEEHRPGLWLKTIPKADELMAAVFQLIGRRVDTGAVPPVEHRVDEREWTPQDDLIDDALQIFEEEVGRPANASPGTDFKVQDTHTGSHRQRSQPPGEAAPERLAPQHGDNHPEVDDEIEVAVSEVTTMPGATGPKRKIFGANNRPPAVAQIDLDAGDDPGADVDMVDEIVERVIERLASKLAKQIDASMIRREIAVVMREKGS